MLDGLPTNSSLGALDYFEPDSYMNRRREKQKRAEQTRLDREKEKDQAWEKKRNDRIEQEEKKREKNRKKRSAAKSKNRSNKKAKTTEKEDDEAELKSGEESSEEVTLAKDGTCSSKATTSDTLTEKAEGTEVSPDQPASDDKDDAK